LKSNNKNAPRKKYIGSYLLAPFDLQIGKISTNEEVEEYTRQNVDKFAFQNHLFTVKNIF